MQKSLHTYGYYYTTAIVVDIQRQKINSYVCFQITEVIFIARTILKTYFNYHVILFSVSYIRRTTFLSLWSDSKFCNMMTICQR